MDLISSRQNALVRACRELADAADPLGARVLLDGLHLVRDARDAGLRLEVVGVASSRLAYDSEERQLAERCDADGTPVYEVTDKAFAAISPVRTPSGLVAIARRTPSDLEAIYGHPTAFVLVVTDVQDPGNLGALVRAAEAGGVTGVLVCGASAHPFSWKALRGSMGSALRLPIASVADSGTCLRRLQDLQFRIIAAVPRDGRDPDAINWSGRLALVVGAEGAGLRDDIRDACDEGVTVPMTPPVESLNVAVATAILIYAARRQRSPVATTTRPSQGPVHDRATADPIRRR